MADLTPKTIAELPDDTSLSGAELFPVMDGSTSRKIPLSTLRNQFQMNATAPDLADGTDLDDLVDPANYVCYGTRTYLHRPTTSAFKLFVSMFFLDGGVKYVLQIAQELGNNCREFRRFHGSSGWSSWLSDNAIYISDANLNEGYSGQPRYYTFDSNTLNTPYKEGTTSFTNGVIISYSSGDNTCTQFCISAGTFLVFSRRQFLPAGGSVEWSPWQKLLVSPLNVQTGNSLADVSSNAVTVTSITFPTPFSNTPQVVATCAGSLTSASTIASIGHLVRNVTTTGFELHVAVNSTISFSQLSYRWIAIAT